MTTETFEVVRYQHADRDRVFAFLREAFSPADAERLIRQWHWKYDANPFNCDGGPHILLLQTGGQLVAMYGRLSFRIVIDGTERLAHHGCDLVVHPAYRGHGLSAHLRDQERTSSVIHFSWQNEASYQVARRDGTAGVPFVSLVRPLDFAHVVQRMLGDHWFGRTVAGMVGTAVQHVPRLHRRTVVPDVAVTSVGSFDERFDRLWQRACRDHHVMLVRDRRYLEWRFAQRPDAHYRIMAATKGSEVVGYMVTRSAERAGERSGYVVDFLVQDQSRPLFATLLDHAVEGLRQDGATVVSCRVAVPPYRRMLYRHRFVRVPGAPRGYIRARLRLPEPGRQGPTDVRDWFLTMGDGDLEMSL